MTDKVDYVFKVIIVGDAGIGKSCMLANFTGREIPKMYVQTQGSSVSAYSTSFKNKKICMKLWDLPGEDDFRTLSSAQYFNAHGAIIAYSMTDQESLTHVKGWIENIDRILPERTLYGLQRVVIGLKSDSNCLSVTKEEGERIAETVGCKHFVGSCRYMGMFNQMFDTLLIGMFTEAKRIENEKNNIHSGIDTLLLTDYQNPDDNDSMGGLKESKYSAFWKCCCFKATVSRWGHNLTT